MMPPKAYLKKNKNKEEQDRMGLMNLFSKILILSSSRIHNM